MINPSNNVGGGSMFYGGLAPIDTSRKYTQPTGQQATTTSTPNSNNKRPRDAMQPFSGPPTATPLNPEPKVIKQGIIFYHSRKKINIQRNPSKGVSSSRSTNG